MDKIISITLCVFVIILAAFAGFFVYNTYVDAAYRNTFSGTYTYTCTITTDAPLYNVTFFIPVPVDPAGNSPMVSAFSSRTMKGVPPTWNTTLFDTGKSTLLKITVPAVVPMDGSTASHPSTVAFSLETASPLPVDTLNPVEKSALFRPVQELKGKACTQERAGGSARCFTYTTAVYAEYQTAAETIVTITSSVTGKNSWTVFEPRSNEYHSDVSLSMNGEHHGWAVLDGELTTGFGTYAMFEGS
jgi:hypothetical protein